MVVEVVAERNQATHDMAHLPQQRLLRVHKLRRSPDQSALADVSQTILRCPMHLCPVSNQGGKWDACVVNRWLHYRISRATELSHERQSVPAGAA